MLLLGIVFLLGFFVVVPIIGSLQPRLVLSTNGIPGSDTLRETNGRLRLYSAICVIGTGIGIISNVEVGFVSGGSFLLLGWSVLL